MIRTVPSLLLALMLTGAAFAAPVSQASVISACTSGASDCEALLTAYLAGLAPATRNQAIADLVVALATGPNATSPTALAAIRTAAALSTDAQQAVRIAEIAATLATGITETTGSIAMVSASPS